MVLLRRIPDAYTAPEHIRAYARRFWWHTQAVGSACKISTLDPNRTVPRARCARGETYTVWDFAYLDQIGDIWPMFVARPRVCGTERCVLPIHLRLGRRAELGPVSEAELDEVVRRYARRSVTGAHRELATPEQIGVALGIGGPEIVRAFRARQYVRAVSSVAAV